MTSGSDKPTIYLLRNKYTCKGWGTLNQVVPKRAWVLDNVWQPDSDKGEYLKAGDELFVVEHDGIYELRIERSGSVVRVLENLQLQGLDTTPALWATAGGLGYDIYLYLLDTSGVDRRIHVDVFYPHSRYNQDRPGPDTVVVEP